MSLLIDTDVAVHLRDGDAEVTARFDALPQIPALSIVSQVELEGGVYARPQITTARRIRVDVLLSRLEIIGFDAPMAIAYREIVAHRGFSRRRITDRMIAATAIVRNLTLITINGADFTDIPGLSLEIWPAPAQ